MATNIGAGEGYTEIYTKYLLINLVLEHLARVRRQGRSAIKNLNPSSLKYQSTSGEMEIFAWASCREEEERASLACKRAS